MSDQGKRPEPSEFWLVKEDVRADERGRLSVGREFADKKYRVLRNDAGQLLFDPVVSVPEREMWLWMNPAARDALVEGRRQLARGEIVDLGSFAEYVESEAGFESDLGADLDEEE